MKTVTTTTVPSFCATARQRVAQDRCKGRTTSQAVLDFIRRTCGCEKCREWRHRRKP